MKPEVAIELISTRGRRDACLLLAGSDPVWIRELFHAIRSLREGRDNTVRAHELPGYAGVGGIELHLHAAGLDSGVSSSVSGRVFDWRRTEAGWTQVEELLAPFCSRDAPVPPPQELDRFGEFRVLFATAQDAGSLTDGVLVRTDGDDATAPAVTGWVGHRRCHLHPLREATTLCHRCATALCAACAEVVHDDRSICAAGCEAQGEIHFYPDADPDYGSLLLVDAKISAARELFHGIRSLRRGRQEVVAAHALPGFTESRHVELYLHQSSQDEGVRKRASGDVFDWRLTPAGWERVEETLGQPCDRYWASGASLDLEEAGDARVIFGGDW